MKPELKFFWPSVEKNWARSHHGRVGVGADEVNVEDVEHIEHRDDGGGDAHAEGQAVQDALGCKGAPPPGSRPP